jgi:hypothetical protein
MRRAKRHKAIDTPSATSGVAAKPEKIGPQVRYVRIRIGTDADLAFEIAGDGSGIHQVEVNDDGNVAEITFARDVTGPEADETVARLLANCKNFIQLLETK